MIRGVLLVALAAFLASAEAGACAASDVSIVQVSAMWRGTARRCGPGSGRAAEVDGLADFREGGTGLGRLRQEEGCEWETGCRFVRRMQRSQRSLNPVGRDGMWGGDGRGLREEAVGLRQPQLQRESGSIGAARWDCLVLVGASVHKWNVLLAWTAVDFTQPAASPTVTWPAVTWPRPALGLSGAGCTSALHTV